MTLNAPTFIASELYEMTIIVTAGTVSYSFHACFEQAMNALASFTVQVLS